MLGQLLKHQHREQLSARVAELEREELNAAFKDSLAAYVQELKAKGVNLAPVESPLDYKKRKIRFWAVFVESSEYSELELIL